MRYVLQFRCPGCDSIRPMIQEGVLHWLRDHGRLVREEKPSNELLFEMARLQAQSKRCEECDHFGLLVEEPEELRDEDWGGQRLCESCRVPLDPDRLEVFPDTTVCAKCQSAEERGDSFRYSTAA